MKKIILTIGIALLTSVIVKAQTAKTEDSSISISQDSASFNVSGNCGMCQRTIEKAALILGVSSAEWNMETGEMKIVYDSAKIDVIKVHQAIANVGYDTDKIKAKTETYDGLPGCCQYDRTE